MPGRAIWWVAGGAVCGLVGALAWKRGYLAGVAGERARVAGDFHDGPLQSFSALRIRMTAARRVVERNPEEALNELRSLEDLCAAQVGEMRGFLNGLRGEARLGEIVERFRRESEMEVEQQGDGMVGEEVALMVKEALHNVYKHAEASRVWVEMETDAEGRWVVIDDNGVGIPEGVTPRSLAERARRAKALLKVRRRPGGGTRVEIRTPA